MRLELNHTEDAAIRLAMQEAARLRTQAEAVVIDVLEAVGADRCVKIPPAVRYSKSVLEWDDPKPAKATAPPQGA
jgi:hypothetical protein